jgi:putative ATPase
MSLFHEDETKYSAASKKILTPLAERVRPRLLAEFVGQEQILSEGKALRAQITSGQMVSMIFWGPPGSGKTTLARIIAKETRSKLLRSAPWMPVWARYEK